MGVKNLTLKMNTDFCHEDLELAIRKTLGITYFELTIIKQSLDGRNKSNIHWNINLDVVSEEISDGETQEIERLSIPKINKELKVAIIGSGPAGYFAGLLLQDAGIKVAIFERGPEVYGRTRAVRDFEKDGILNERANYAFGEGGAGTFSDGKLTSRTKTITKEKRYIFEKFIDYGAPDEILYLAKPHLGTNLLTKIVKNLRNDFIKKGGEIFFDTDVSDFHIKDSKVISIDTEKGLFEADYYIFAIGHSSFDTYKKMINKGIQFKTKPFAIGSRVEHYQELINQAQWGVKELSGIKSAEYYLTYSMPKSLPVYSFCMCPGGMVVSAPPENGINIVNGMSNYKRNSKFANSAIVAGIDLNLMLNKIVNPIEALDWLNNLERNFFRFSNGFDAPSVKVADLIRNKVTNSFGDSSYPFKLITADFNQLFPKGVVKSLIDGVKNFKGKIKGFEEGYFIGLESKTSSPIQVIRDGMKCAGFDNLYLAGEGSGLSGGIVSSAADGLKAAMDIINSEA